MKIIEFLKPKKTKLAYVNDSKIFLNASQDAFAFNPSNTFLDAVDGIEFSMDFRLGKMTHSAYNGKVNTNLYIIDNDTDIEYRLTQKEIVNVFKLVNYCFKNSLPLTGIFKTDSTHLIRFSK